MTAVFILLRQAVVQYQEHIGRDELFTVLTYLIRDGAIEAHRDRTTGEWWVRADDTLLSVVSNLDRRKWMDLRGQERSLLVASQKTNIAVSTLQRWVKRGYLKEIRNDGISSYIDAADAAFVGAMWALVGKPGRSLFPLLTMDK